MSGGSFDYKCFLISQFAEELEMKIRNNMEKNEWGECDGFSPSTIAALKRCHHIIQCAGDMAKEIEWLYSSDIGEDTFMVEFNKLVANYIVRSEELT
jgi:hypothetical protein